MCNQEFVGLTCMTAPREIRHQYQTTKFASIFIRVAMVVLKTSGIISEPPDHFAYVPTLEVYSRALTRDH
jgi:hypothetical protein